MICGGTPGHRVTALRELRAGVVKARRPRYSARGRSVATSLDGAEHGSKIDSAMALVMPQQMATRLQLLLQHRTPLRNGQDDNDDAGVSDPLWKQAGPSRPRPMGVAHALIAWTVSRCSPIAAKNAA